MAVQAGEFMQCKHPDAQDFEDAGDIMCDCGGALMREMDWYRQQSGDSELLARLKKEFGGTCELFEEI